MILDNKNDSLFKNSENNEHDKYQDDYSDNVKKKNLFSRITAYFSKDSTGVRVLFLVGIIAIILGIWRLGITIKGAFVFSPIVLEDKAGIAESLYRLKDTDGDGLSDYDEIYVYGTSPYLRDTDSDNISDYDEIAMGSSALCKEGESCSIDFSEEEASGLDLEISGAGNAMDISLKDIKDMLIQAGYPAEMVNKLTEEDLAKIYEEVQKAAFSENYEFQGIDSEEESKTGLEPEPELSPDMLEQLKNLPIDEIKQLLIQGGAEQNQIDQISDEELRSLYLEALEEIGD